MYTPHTKYTFIQALVTIGQNLKAKCPSTAGQINKLQNIIKWKLNQLYSATLIYLTNLIMFHIKSIHWTHLYVIQKTGKTELKYLRKMYRKKAWSASIWIVVTLGWDVGVNWLRNSFWGAGNILFLDLGGSYTSIHFVKIH